MRTINFTLADGTVRTVEGADGESLMRIALGNDVPGIIGECGGELSCGTCHVYVDAQWTGKLPPQSADEADLMDMMDSYRPEASRLGCQIRACAELDGLTVEVAPDN
ncbi:2Fe-2S iron-sulfur cluster-binding protein [Arthrobacter mobilis]|uniref:2Fe-2S iron-sulfur cluster binding domain-containing protein n=1 Tax=Arthrobacter mobilis TaxID=2724944 RepID=A0A7X6K7G3_9MICC|nr:2Fe-2S iron-sulfur cluster-binding protein [Arthrobacter mobilis]NKX56558.1 2Fe-2S iron-sulfur cluster binding domain-containing protein [Arthrobacter mobilis]